MERDSEELLVIACESIEVYTCLLEFYLCAELWEVIFITGGVHIDREI